MRHLTAAWSRVAMPMNPPDDLTFEYLEGMAFGSGPTVAAISGGKVIGTLSMILEGSTLYNQEWIVDLVYVVPPWRRKGIGTLLFEEGVKHKPDLRHSEYRSDLGDAWALARSKGEALPRWQVLEDSKTEQLGREQLVRVSDRLGLL